MDDDILAEFLAESWENLGRLDIEIVELEKRPRDGELLASIFRTIHTIKGTCGFIGLTGLGSVAHAAEGVLGRMRDGALTATPDVISLVLQAVDEIKVYLDGLEKTSQEPVRDHAALTHRLDELCGLVAPASALDVPTEANSVLSEGAHAGVPAFREAYTLPPVLPEIHEVDPELDAAAGMEGKKSIQDLSIRVGVDVLDRLMNLVGELVLTRNQLMQMVRGEDESKYVAPIAHLNRVTTDLQEGVMKTRMQPIGNAWSKLPRLVRDLAKHIGKQIELELIGAETELDRTVLDAIKDPLTHMVRNSADHGLETPAARRAQGKSETGKIRLNAYHEGGHVIICIEDDGAGIPLQRIRDKAIKNGLVSESDAARLSDKETLAFIFRPGFSTAEKVSSVSGRGVGMDVVKTQIERIGGTVELSTKVGAGTTIRIKIPLTLAIISALVIESGGLSFAIPQLGVVELVRLAAEDRHKIERIHEYEVFRLRHRLLPLVHLDDVLGLAPPVRSDDQDVNIVVVQVGEDQFGLIVSEVFDTEEIVVKPVGNLLKDLQIYQGTTILGDGRVIMILDVGGIASQVGTHLQDGMGHDALRGEQEDAEGELTRLLMFEAGEASNMAVPLSLVARLEEFPRKDIERSGDRLVVQYRGDLLPLLPIHGATNGTPDPQPVIVFSEGQSSMGLMVDRIQDIQEERLMIRMPSRRSGVLGTAIVNGRATDIIDLRHYITNANPEWFNRKFAESWRILVVDDSVFFRQLVTTALETEGHKVLAVSGGREALERLDRGPRFDAIVCDIEMPEVDGLEFARRFRQRPAETRTPLIALTSLAGQRHEEPAAAAGFDRFLTKFDPQQLVRAVEELCRPQGSAYMTGVGA